jgi:hypothetical protein
MRGVKIISWQTPGGRADSFVLAFSDQASERWLRLADVVVHPNQATTSAAAGLAASTLRRLPGCTVVAVGVDRERCVLGCRAARSTYLLLVLSRSSQAAMSSALGSSPSE